MIAPMPDRRSKEEREADHQKWVDQHYLEPGKKYTYEVNRYWSHSTPRGFRVHVWHANIKQAECPWSICGVVDSKTKWGAILKAKAYLKRGGPPPGYFD